MSKIKFSKEWYNNNKVAIRCKTEDESILLTRELHRAGIQAGWDMFSVYYHYKNKTCYSCNGDKIGYANIDYYIGKGYGIVDLSDLEFEDEMKTLANNLKTLGESYDSNSLTANTRHKRTILRESVKLNNGDVVATRSYLGNPEPLCYGIVLSSNILYNNGDFDKIDSLQDIIDEDLVWYIKAEDYIYLGGYMSELLFKGELDDELKDLIIHVQDKPKEPIKREVEIFKVKFYRGVASTTPFISDDKSIYMNNVVSPIGGIFTGRYGVVGSRLYDELTQEQIDTYDKIIKIR